MYDANIIKTYVSYNITSWLPSFARAPPSLPLPPIRPAEWLTWDTLTMFEATVCGRS